MRARPTSAFVALAILLWLGPFHAVEVRANPTLSGPTGMILVPTALTLGRHEVDVAADLHRVGRTDGRPSFAFTSVRGAVGILDRNDAGLEVGFVKPQASAIDVTDAYLFAKYRIAGILPGGALAAGGTFSTDKRHYTSAFVVGSSAIARNLTLHYGGGVNIYGDPRGFSYFGGRTSADRADPAFALFGAELDVHRFKLNVEYNGAFLSYGVNYYPESFFSLSAFKLGRGDYERLLKLDYGLGFGATVRF